MAIKRKATSQLQRTKGLDFRCPDPDDDGWYGVRLLKVKEGILRVMYLEFPEESDEWYLSDQFESLAQINELLGRFRRPAEQLQDSQCGEVTQGMVVLACDTFRNDEILFYDARVDSVSRSKHKSNGDSEEQLCNCQFLVTWRHGPEIGKHATVRAENICLIQDSPIDDPVLKDFIDNAKKSLKERIGNLASQGRNSGLNPAASSHGASPNPANVLEMIDVKSSDCSHHHELDDIIGQTRDSIGTLGEEKDALKERCSRAEAEVARLKARVAEMEEQARTTSAWEKEKSELERKVEHLEEVLDEELYFEKEKERYEGLLQELNAQSQIFKAQMQVAKAEREQAILALYEVEAKLKGKRYQVGKSASEWKFPEHLTLPPSETVLTTIRNSQAFAPFRRQIEKEIHEHLMKQHTAGSPTQVSRSKHKSNGDSEEQVGNCQFLVTWRHGPEIGKRATVRSENICLIQDSPIDDPVLKDCIDNAKKSLKERIGNLASQGRNDGLNPAASSHGASPNPANVLELIDVKSSDGSHHHEENGQSYEATKPQNKFGGEASTELASKGLTTARKKCCFFWVDNMDDDIEPPKIVKFLQRELSVSCQVVLFPNLFLDNTCSGAIYVESREHANRVLKFLTKCNNIIVSLKGRPWVTSEKCCGILNCPMPLQEMNLDTENQDDVNEIRVLRPGSEGYEEASKMHDLFKAHCDRIETLRQSLRSEELKLRNTFANGSRSGRFSRQGAL